MLIPILVVLTWLIARRSLANASLGRRVFLFCIRSFVLAMLCVALAQPSADRKAKDVAVVVIRDQSQSMPADQQRLVDDFLVASAKLKNPSDRLGLITTAKDPFVQSLPSSGEPRLEIDFVGETTATNLQQPIQLARALIPPDAAGRILLITDANQTDGSFIDAARAAAGAGSENGAVAGPSGSRGGGGMVGGAIPIDVLGVQYDRSHEIRVESLVVPPWTRINDTINARVIVQSGRDAVANLSVMMNSQVVDLDPDSPSLSAPVQLKQGSNLFTIPLKLTSAAVHRLTAVIEPIDTGDLGRDQSRDVAELLRASAVTFSSAKGRVLVISEDSAAIQPFIDAIDSDEIAIDVRTSQQIPADFTDLAAYDAVVLADQPAFNFSQAQQEDFVRYTRDTGGGLLVLGGPNALGAGGWIGTPLADALPVLLDPPAKRQMPQGALALVIDSSGSMGMTVGKTGATQLQLANEASILTARSLSRLDDIAVVTFNSESRVVVPLMRCSNADMIERAIRGIGLGGGTYLFPGVELAAEELSKSRAGVRHIIVLTDGQTTGDPTQTLALAASLRRNGITLSAVVIGDFPDEDLLRRLAAAAGGRSHVVSGDAAIAELPQIFIKEAEIIRRSLIHEGDPFTPSLSFRTDSLSGIPSPLPAITGYVVTADRPGLTLVPLRGPENDPILAQWQHGLGHVTVFTSDATTRWNRQWTGWPAFAAFWNQQLAWTMRPSGDPHSRVTVNQEGGSATINVELFNENDEPLSFAAVRGRIADAQADINFHQIGPGKYQATVNTDKPGVHLVGIEYRTPDARRGSLRAAVVKREGDELRRPTPDQALLQHAAKLTGGRVYTLTPTGADLWTREGLVFPVSSRPIWLLAAIVAVALFLIDVASRRIAFDFQKMRARVFALASAKPTVKSATLKGLTAAKARAGDSMKPAAPAFEEPPLESVAPLTSATQTLFETESSTPPIVQQAPKQAAPAEDIDPMARLQAAKRRARPK